MFANSVIINSPGKKINDRHPQRHHRPVSSATIPNGTIVFFEWPHHRRRRERVDPSNATVIDGTGLFVYPVSSTPARMSDSRRSAPSQAPSTPRSSATSIRMRAPRFAVNPHSNVIPVTRVNGITSVVTEPEAASSPAHLHS